jgi:hypothetical protein
VQQRHRLAPVFRRALLAVGFAGVLAAALAAAARAPSRIVAVADVHGAFPELVAILQRAQLIDARLRWTGGSATLVQTGDVLDRGSRSRECLDLVMQLEREAPRQGGKVVAMLGNHEVMNIMGDLRYATADIFHTFASGASGKRRTQEQAAYVKFLSSHNGHSHTAAAPSDSVMSRAWMDAHPPGFFEYRDAFGPAGKYGRWIREHHAVVQIGDGVFVHGGLSPVLQFGSVRELDARVAGEVAAYDSIWRALVDRKVVWRYMTLVEAVRFVGEEVQWMQANGQASGQNPIEPMRRLLDYKTWMAASSGGPLWYRGLASGPEDSLAPGVNAMLTRLSAHYIVVGHTVASKTDITTRFDGRVFLLDTGMLKEEYAGRASALEVQDGRFTAFYVDGAAKLLRAAAAPIPAARPVTQAQRKL